MKARVKKPIRLKAMAGQPTPEIAVMQADLEGRSASARSKSTRSLWTREFLASGKPAS